MDLRHLRTFVTVVEQGTVSKAAVHLHTAQPALSRQISDLEQELGLKLFDRIGRRLLLTLEGEQLLGSCRSALNQIGSISDHAQMLRGGDTGLLKVAASPIQIESVLATFLPIYAKRYPNVQVKLIEAVGSETLAMMARGDIHLCISLLDVVQAADRGLGAHPVKPLELMAACHPSFQLKQDGAIDIGRIATFPLLLQDQTFILRQKFDAICHLARLQPNIVIESRAPHTLLSLAETGLGIAIVPSVIRIDRYKLDTVQITYKRKPIGDPLAVVWDKRRALPHYAEDFCELLAVHMRDLSPAGSVASVSDGGALNPNRMASAPRTSLRVSSQGE